MYIFVVTLCYTSGVSCAHHGKRSVKSVQRLYVFSAQCPLLFSWNRVRSIPTEQKTVIGNWGEGEPWSHNMTSQNRWHAFVQGRINDPDTQPVPLLITLRMPWNNLSTLSHCDDGELMRPPSFSSGYMLNSFRSIMASAKPHTSLCEPDPLLRLLLGTDAISVAIMPQT